ncbi:MAG: diadenylate cyclase CdaA [Oscillospiraceae bacterium]|nr:diadenylate cyclase CdaA [Oscillospiraceae bacterium]
MMNYLAQFWPRLWHMIVSYLAQCWEAIQLAIGDFNIFRDTIDIALIAYIIYKGIQIIRETRASQLVKGILLLAGLYIVVYAAQLRTTLWLLNKVIEMGILIIFIVFQPELRSILERAGRTNLSVFPFSHSENSLRQATIWGEPIDVVCEAAQRLSITATGALIVIEREVKLGDQIRTGVVVDAVPSVELIGNIFFKNSPLHDGAMIMRDGKVYAAGCFLPKPKQEQDIDKSLGSRHRAAIGISEVSDSLTIVVSEETGGMSLAVNGRLIRNLSVEKLHQTLDYYLLPHEEAADKKKKPPIFYRRAK